MDRLLGRSKNDDVKGDVFSHMLEFSDGLITHIKHLQDEKDSTPDNEVENIDIKKAVDVIKILYKKIKQEERLIRYFGLFPKLKVSIDNQKKHVTAMSLSVREKRFEDALNLAYQFREMVSGAKIVVESSKSKEEAA